MRRIPLAVVLLAAAVLPFLGQRPSDNERLGMALEYFHSGKYHESILLFEQLDKEYTLNERYHAFMGVCYYYEWQYEDACKYLDSAMPHLEVFAPHERSVYYFTAGESHFQLQEYSKAIPYYEKALTVCYENEKGDIYYRLGMCYMFAEQWESARKHYEQALNNYLLLRDTPEMKARIYQTASMMKGCEEKITKPSPSSHPINEAPSDSLNISIGTSQKPDNATDHVIQITEMVSPSITPSVTIPQISFTGDTAALPQKVAMPHSSLPTERTLVRDTIRSEVPSTINLQEIYKPGVELKE